MRLKTADLLARMLEVAEQVQQPLQRYAVVQQLLLSWLLPGQLQIPTAATLKVMQ
jgi:hypothetical protein